MSAGKNQSEFEFRPITKQYFEILVDFAGWHDKQRDFLIFYCLMPHKKNWIGWIVITYVYWLLNSDLLKNRDHYLSLEPTLKSLISKNKHGVFLILFEKIFPTICLIRTSTFINFWETCHIYCLLCNKYKIWTNLIQFDPNLIWHHQNNNPTFKWSHFNENTAII